jgi:hypothetical protein
MASAAISSHQVADFCYHWKAEVRLYLSSQHIWRFSPSLWKPETATHSTKRKTRNAKGHSLTQIVIGQSFRNRKVEIRRQQMLALAILQRKS